MKIQEAIKTNKYVCRKSQPDSAFCYHQPNTGPFKDLVSCDYFSIYEDGFLTFSTTAPDLYADELLADDYQISLVTALQLKEALERTNKFQASDEQQDNILSNKTTYTTFTKLPTSLTKELLLKIANSVLCYKVDQWHTSKNNTKSLAEHLNMNSGDYFAWVEKSDTLSENYLVSLLKEYNKILKNTKISFNIVN